MALPATARMPAADRREQLLDVTKRIAATRGFHAVSIEAVSREAGITRPVVYGHFRDLGALLDALVERENTRARQQLEAVVPETLAEGNAREILLEGLRGYLEAVAADPDTWSLVLMPPEGAPPLLRERIAEGRAAVVTQLAAALGPGLVPGSESPDPELTARTFSGLSDDAARLVLTEPERYPVDRLVAHARWLLDHFAP